MMLELYWLYKGMDGMVSSFRIGVSNGLLGVLSAVEGGC